MKGDDYLEHLESCKRQDERLMICSKKNRPEVYEKLLNFSNKLVAERIRMIYYKLSRNECFNFFHNGAFTFLNIYYGNYPNFNNKNYISLKLGPTELTSKFIDCDIVGPIKTKHHSLSSFEELKSLLTEYIKNYVAKYNIKQTSAPNILI